MTGWLATIGLMTVHLTWFGALLAAGVALAFRAGWPVEPGRRAVVAQAALGLLGVWAIVLSNLVPTGVLGGSVPILVSVPHAAGGGRGLDAFGAVLPWIGAMSLLVTALALGRLGAAYHQSLRIRRHTRVPPAAWVDALHAAMAGGPSRVALRLHAGKVPAPVLHGCFRPALIVPLTDQDGLAPEDRTRIVAHELAHTARRDGLALYASALMRALLAPIAAVHWLADAAETEREAACDAAVVRSGIAATDYVRTLLRLVEPRPPLRRLVLPFSGGSLVRRVERLLCPEAQPMRHPAAAWVFVASLAAPALAMPAWLPPSRDALAAAVVPDQMAIDAHDDAGSFRIEFRRGRPVAAAAEGVALATPSLVRGDSLRLETRSGDPVVTLRLQRHQVTWENRPASAPRPLPKP
jgi:hypothetical protein